MKQKTLVTIGKWAFKIGFAIPYQKGTHWCYRFLYNFVLFTVNITDLYGLVVIFNITIRWDKIYKGVAMPGGEYLKHPISSTIRIKKGK